MLILICLSSASPAQTISRVSLGSGAVQGNGGSNFAGISDDGRYVAFRSAASNLVPGDTNGQEDVFIRDRQTGVTSRISIGTAGVQANGESAGLWMSGDGRYVAFSSFATNLVPNDMNGMLDAFVHDRQTGVTTCVSVDSNGVPGNGTSYWVSITANGQYAYFHSFASNLVVGDTNGTWDVFGRNLQAGTTTRVSLTWTGAQANGECSLPFISPDGHYVTFFSLASNLVPGDTNGADIFVRNVVAGTTERVSVATGGGQSDGLSTYPVISADGRYVAFQSEATNLVTPYTDWDAPNIYVRDRLAGTTELVSVASDGTQGNHVSERPSISADGRYVTFYSASTNLVLGDTNINSDVFLHDRQSGTTIRVSVHEHGAQLPTESFASERSISADGRCVTFQNGGAVVPEDTNQATDCFARDFGPTFTTFCHGDGTGTPCPCSNNGLLAHGCDNSDGTGGALLGHSGAPRPSDSVVLDVLGQRANSLTIFVQGSTLIVPIAYGDGLRCIGGVLKRLYVKAAVNGAATAPLPNEPSITTRSAALNDSIPPGATRYYMTYYRDGEAGFCTIPGSTFNSSNALSIVW